MSEIIYVACPYWHDDPTVRQSRAEIATAYAAHLATKGHAVYSPLTHTVPLSQLEPEIPEAFWLGNSLAMLQHCTEMHLLTLPGWKESKGVRAEWEHCSAAGKTVVMVMPKLAKHGGGYEFPRL